MEDVQQQLAALRRRIARIDRKYERQGALRRGGFGEHPDAAQDRGSYSEQKRERHSAEHTERHASAEVGHATAEEASAAGVAMQGSIQLDHLGRSRPSRQAVEELLSGEVVRTRRGRHFETERVWERHRRHGSVGIADLSGLAPDLLAALSGGAISEVAPEKLAFLDTETTGLGAGACAFLVGVGSIDSAGFRLRQFLMRDWDEEASLLTRLADYLGRFEALVTYNGRTFDQPLLEGRFYISRVRHPFARLPHLDL